MNKSFLDFSLLHESVECQAIQRPQQIAIDAGTHSISYADLCDQMHRIAATLQTNGIQNNDRVGLLTGHGIEACVGMLGILRADACYVPLNPVFPAMRLGAVIEDAGIQILVTVKKYTPHLLEILSSIKDFQGDALMLIDASLDDPEGLELKKEFAKYFKVICGAETIAQAGSPSESLAVEDNLAYVMYTSGSTGTPKGVMVTHRNVTSFLRWGIDYFSISSRDRMSGHSDINFDLSVFDIFGSFFSGATLCPVINVGDKSFPGKFIKDREISIWFSVPSVIRTLRNSGQLSPNIFAKHLRWAIFCGEVFLPEYADSWIKSHPTVPLCNLYGPTEATIACTYYKVGDDGFWDPGKPIPIGHPTSATQILILKQQSDEIADDGEIGRLMICGTQVSPGYWGQPELTQNKFTRHPLDLNSRMYDSSDLAYREGDGVIQFVGRSDSQVKIMGYRVELGEIETIVTRHEAVDEAVAFLMQDEQALLVAAVSLNLEFSGSDYEKDILSHCVKYLPLYMVPKRLLFFSSLPKNSNGKIDRKAIAQFDFLPS
jgi:amino acid adenylation domain-containing protein